MDIKDSIENILSKYAVVGKNYIHQSRKINGYEFFWFEEISKLFSEQKPDIKWLLNSLSNHTKIRHFVICWLEDDQMQTISIPVLKEDAEGMRLAMIETKEALKARVRILREVGEQLRQIDEQSYQIWREVVFRQPEEVVAAQSPLFGKALAYAGALFCDSED